MATSNPKSAARKELRRTLAENGTTMQEYIVSACESLGTQAAVAAALGVSESYVSKALRRAGIPRTVARRTPSQLKQMREMHAKGVSIAEICAELGLSYHAVYFSLFPEKRKR